MTRIGNRDGTVSRGDLQEVEEGITDRLERGEIIIPTVSPTQVNIAGGTNHCPDSDLSYSTLAATVAGTLPADVDDLNFEDWRAYRQTKDANVTLDAAHALKSVDHTLYAASEGADSRIPIWNRVSGWVEMGSDDAGAQYDVIKQLLNKPVGPGQRWFFLCRLVALTADVVPTALQLGVGFWQKGATEGWATGDAFDLQFTIEGMPGSVSAEYRVLASTDSGVSILSNILTIPNAPDVFSAVDYPKIFYFAGPGFIEFAIFRKMNGVFSHLFTVRNTTDFQYNDTGKVHIGSVQDWPAAPAAGDSPQAYAQTRTVRIGAYNGAWALVQLAIVVPSTYDSSATDADGQFLRIQLTTPTAVDRQIGIDRIWLSTTLNEWAPDPPIKFADGTFATPSVSPSSGTQGSGDGVYGPPIDGSGGDPCVLASMPVLTAGSWLKPFRFIVAGLLSQLRDLLVGEFPEPYQILGARTVTVSEYVVIETANGITYECSLNHRLCHIRIDDSMYIRAQDVVPGVTRLVSWERRWWSWSRQVRTLVTKKTFVPETCEVVPLSLRHPAGRRKDGEGHYVAGWSARMDRGLFSSNRKILEQGPVA